jgi:hypothetical protein
MTGAMPRTAVVLCTHNGARHVGELLASIEGQCRAVDEVHVFDWASTDTTRDCIRRWMASGPAQRHTALHELDTAPGPGRSFLHALTLVARTSSADLVFIADQDDVWRHDKLERFIDEYLRQPFDVAHSDVEVLYESQSRRVASFYGQGGPFLQPEPEPAGSVLITNTAIGMTMCVRRSWVERASAAFMLEWVMHDWALVILCWLQGARRRFISAPLVTYRQHGANTLGAHDTRSFRHKLGGARRHVLAVRRQIRAAQQAAALLGCPAAAGQAVRGMDNRVRQALLAWRTRTLTPRYRCLLALSFLLL